MSRKRSPENVGLPARWVMWHGAYYFQVPPGLEDLWDGKRKYRLGKTLPEAYRAWSQKLDTTQNAKTIGDLLDRYLLEVVPTKAPGTREDNVSQAKQLRTIFGAMPLLGLKPRHVYLYVDKRSQKKVNEAGRTTGGLAIARREAKLLSHAFTKAVEWGYVDRHPFLKELRLAGSKPRDRYIEDWEIEECLKLDSKRKKGSLSAIQAYIILKLMTGMARSDLLRLTMADIKPDGIHIQRHKTKDSSGKRTIYQMTPELERAVEMAKAARPRISPYLFCNRNGQPYIDDETGKSDGWDSMWQRFMDRVLKETKVTEKFTEHDLRAKAASDADTLDHARALLSHTDARTTETIYRRKPERVLPLNPSANNNKKSG